MKEFESSKREEGEDVTPEESSERASGDAMITYGITMENRGDRVPAEVAVWLFEHGDRRPNVEFKVDVQDISEEDVGEHEKVRQKYALLWKVNPKTNAPINVVFLYPRQSWFVRIIGDLSPEERREIADMPDTVELVSQENDAWATVGIPFQDGGAPDDEPVEHIEIDPDKRWAAELTMSAAEVQDLVTGPSTERKEALIEAISKKDWETARELLKKRH